MLNERDLNRASKDKLAEFVSNKVHLEVPLPVHILLLLKFIFEKNPLNRKQAIFFLISLKKEPAVVAYVYRHLVRTASMVGVPRTVISNYTDKLEMYKEQKRRHPLQFRGRKSITVSRQDLREASYLLLTTTVELLGSKSERERKLRKLFDSLSEEVD